MTTHKQMRADLDSALHTLTHPRRRAEERDSEEHDHVGSARNERPRKHFHVHELHDGSYHVEKDHGEGKMESGSANDVDEVHDALEEHFGGPNEDEEHAEHEEHSHY